MGRTTYNLTNEELITRALIWLTKFKSYRDIDKGHTGSPAVTYNRVWVQLIRRIKDYTEDNKNLVRLYRGLEKTDKFDTKIKNIILRCLEYEAKKRGMLYFMNDLEAQKLINEIFKTNRRM